MCTSSISLASCAMSCIDAILRISDPYADLHRSIRHYVKQHSLDITLSLSFFTYFGQFFNVASNNNIIICPQFSHHVLFNSHITRSRRQSVLPVTVSVPIDVFMIYIASSMK